MNVLFLYPADGTFFERQTIDRCFQDLSALFSEIEIEGDEYALWKGRFDLEGESNAIELQRSLKAVILGPEGKAALKLAFELQYLYPAPLNITNESFSFELCVKDFSSYEEFEYRVLEILKGAD